jgi:hypothetical protein
MGALKLQSFFGEEVDFEWCDDWRHFDDEESGELGGVAWVEAVCFVALQLPPELKRWMLGMVFRCGSQHWR